MGQEAQRVGRAGTRAGTLVLDLKIARGDYCSKEDRDTQHQGTYGVEGRHSLSWKECVGVCVGKIEPDRWSEIGKIICEEQILRLD